MRSEKLWFGIDDRNIGCDLKNYPNLIKLSNPQNVSFSQKNIKNPKDWIRLVDELKKPI
jgi:hypothetical protein